MTGGTVSGYHLVEILEREETTVYRAEDLRDGEWVVLELLPATRFHQGTEAESRFRRERGLAAGLDHPHISPALDVGETSDGSVFVTRSPSDGETLRSRIGRGPLSLEHSVGLASQIAAALGRAHEAGILHRDLRPANVLVNGDGQVRVSGFGLSWLLANDSCPVSMAAYRAPEQLRGTPPDALDARTDVWSLGVLLYQMLTGRRPFRGANRTELLSAILEHDPEPMSAVLPGIPAELEQAVAEALSKDPAGRPARMDDFLVALRRILAGGVLPAVDSTVVQVPGLRTPLPDAAPRAEPGAAAGVAAEGGTVAQYRIQGLLGSGAMGTVYRAEDTRLRRTVALKFLATELSLDPVAKARFFQEAQAASALDHPNICTIHEVGETADGHLYLAMASYDGETVRARLARGPLPVAEAVEIAARSPSASPRPTARHRPPRRQAGQPHGHRRRRGQGARLRRRQAAGRRPASTSRARSWARRPTCRRSRRGARRSIPEPISGRSASSSTRCWPALGLSRVRTT